MNEGSISLVSFDNEIFSEIPQSEETKEREKREREKWEMEKSHDGIEEKKNGGDDREAKGNQWKYSWLSWLYFHFDYLWI